jgi:hypothetical protein
MRFTSTRVDVGQRGFSPRLEVQKGKISPVPKPLAVRINRLFEQSCLGFSGSKLTLVFLLVW